jgi:putative membrane protein
LRNGKTLIVSIIFDGLFVLAIDLFMDPVEVRQGAWTWINGGPYFGVPIGNFIGWFVVAIIASGIFRSIEYFFPYQNVKFDKSILIIPVILYGFVALSLMGMALRYRMYELGIIGTLLMVPTVVLNLILFNVFRKKK